MVATTRTIAFYLSVILVPLFLSLYLINRYSYSIVKNITIATTKKGYVVNTVDDDEEEDDIDVDKLEGRTTTTTTAKRQHNTTRTSVTDVDKGGRNRNHSPTMLRKSMPSTAAAAAAATNTTSATPHSSSQQQNSPYAYALVLGGCDPLNPKYRGYLYGAYVACYLLRKHGSRSDIIMLVEMYHGSNYTRLPPEEERVLQQLNVTVKYIPKRPSQSFHTIQLNKFRILGFTQYRRIFYLDSDVIPMTNLDFFFMYSDPQHDVVMMNNSNTTSAVLLQENMIVSGKYSPANGGTFMLKPHVGDLEKINAIIQQQERNLNKKGSGSFDRDGMGWGHRVGKWEGRTGEVGKHWNFNACDSDQGLLFYWTKYIQQKVSMLGKGGKIENWGPIRVPNSNSSSARKLIKLPVRRHRSSSTKHKHNSRLSTKEGDVEVKQIIQNPFHHIVSSLPRNNCLTDACDGVYRAFAHIAGSGNKPWQRRLPNELTEKTKYKSATHYWYYTFREMNLRHNAGIVLEKIHIKKNEAEHPGVPRARKGEGSARNTQLTNLLDELYD